VTALTFLVFTWGSIVHFSMQTPDSPFDNVRIPCIVTNVIAWVLFIVLFLPVIVVKSNLLLTSIRQQMNLLTSNTDDVNQYNQVGTYVLSSMGILAILMSFLGDKLHYQLHTTTITFFAALNSAFGLIPIVALQVIRYVAIGLIYPYAIGFSISFIIRYIHWEFFGVTFAFVAVLCGIFNFALVKVAEMVLEEKTVFYMNLIFLVGTLLFFIYPLVLTFRLFMRKRKKTQRF